MKNPQEKQTVIKSALKMALGTLSSRVLGLVRDALLVAFFDRRVSDAFVAAFRLPNFFRRFLGEGALNVSFVPVFIDHLHGEGEEELRRKRAMKLANSVFTLLSIVTSTLSVLGIIFMEVLLRWFLGTEAILEVPGKLELITLFARLMFVYLFLVTSYAFFMAVANSMRSFFIPALAPAAFNVCVIIAILMPEPSPTYPGLGLTLGVLVGGGVQFLMVAIKLWSLGALPRLTFQIRVPGLGQVLRAMGPGLLGLGVLQVISIINLRYAALLPEGSLTYVYYGDRLLELPQSILAISLGTALLPSLSELLTKGHRTQMLEVAAKYMRLLMFLALPCAVGLFILARPIVEALYGRGEFGPDDIAATAGVIQIYSLLLVAASFTKILVPSFYALKDTKTPALISVGVVIVHVMVTPLLMSKMGFEGLVWGTTISGFSNTLMLLAVYKTKVGDLFLKKLLLSVIKTLPALLGLAVIAFYSHKFLILIQDSFSGSFLNEVSRSIVLAVSIIAAAVAYFLIAHLCRIEEAGLFLETFKRRWKRRKS